MVEQKTQEKTSQADHEACSHDSCSHGSHEAVHAHVSAEDHALKTQEPQTSEFTKGAIHVTMIESPGCSIKLIVKAEPAATAETRREAVKKVSKEISLPGYRKGKAPEALVMQNFGKHVIQEWEESLANRLLKESLELSKTAPIHPKHIAFNWIEKPTAEKGALVEYTFERAPTVPEISVDALTLQKVEVTPVTEDDVDQSVEGIRNYHTNWKEVTKRAVQEGDMITVDIVDISAEGSPKTIGHGEKLEVAKGNMGAWLRTLVVGMSTGDESVPTMSEVDDETPRHIREDFKPTLCKVTVKKIESGTKPAVDEELAKKAGADSVEVLRTRLRERLERHATEEAQAKMKEQLENALLTRYRFEVPKSLMDSEREERIKQKIHALRRQKKTKEEITSMEGQIEQEVARSAYKAVHIFFIARAVAAREGIAITTEELQAAMGRLIQQGAFGSMDFSKLFQKDSDLMGKISIDVLVNKTMDHLLAQVIAK